MGSKGPEPTEGRKAISTKFQQLKSRPPKRRMCMEEHVITI